ncbi:hypothetical protein Tco_0368347 [Tanacetum coccineum]
MYDSWASRIRLFIKGNKHGRMMLDLIDNGLLVYLAVEENGQTRPKKYFELTEAQQLQDDCDVQATNIIIHGLPPDVYALMWDRVKMLMKGTELSYQERECRLYNLFDKFAHVSGEIFKFVIDVKLTKSLYTTNYDQLYAYLSQHERHANEVRISRERYPDSLAFVANSPTLYNPSQSPQHSVSPPPFISPSMTPQSQAEFPQLDFGLAVPIFQQGEDPIECINKAMEFLFAVASRFPPSNNQLRTSSNPRNQATIQDGEIDEEQLAFLADLGISEAPVAHQTIPYNLAFQIDDLDAYDSDCDDLSSAKAVLMANLSSCDPEVHSEVPYSDSYPNDMINQDVQEMQYSEQTHVDDLKIIRYIVDTTPFAPNDLLVLSLVEQMTDHVAHLDKENQKNKMVDLNQREKLIDFQMDDLIRDRNAKHAAFQQEIDLLKETLFNNVKEKESLSKTLNVFKTDVIAKEHAVISVNDDQETLILEEESRSKMLDKQNDPISIEKNIKISPIDYSKLNKLKKDFGKRFVTQKELSAVQAFWLKHSSLSETPFTSHTPVRIEAPSELPKSQDKDTVIRKLKERIKSLSIKDRVENVKKDIDEIETINIELEHSVAKLLSENENLRKELKHLKSIFKDQFDSIGKTRVKSKEHCDSLIAQINAKSVENLDLNAQLQEKVLAITALKNEVRKLKGKNVVNTVVLKPNATIGPGMFKLDIEPISHRLKNNRDAHEVYIDKTIEYADTLRGFVERARTQYPSEPLLDLLACTDIKKKKKKDKTGRNRARDLKERKKTRSTMPSNFIGPAPWNNIALITRNKSNLDALSMDDLYNNLKVYESKIKGQTSSSSNSQNVAFVSSDNSSSTNETVNTAHSVSAASSKDQASTTSYVDDIDADDLKEMDLKWQVAMLIMRVKRFIKKTGRKLDLNGKETVGFDRTKVECYNFHRRGHFARECMAQRNQGNRNRDDPRRNAPVDTSITNALVVQDRIGSYDWSFQAEEGITNFALMSYTSEALQKQYDQQREALNKSNLEIIGYQMGLESLEARIVVHEKNEAVYEENIAFLKYDVQVKDISIKDLKNQLEEALKEKDDLKLKLENFEESSKNLTKLINSQISAKDKTGLGYDSQMNESELNNIHMNESEVVHSVFNSRESDVDDNILIDSSPKFDYLLKEFSGELAHINPIPPGIEKADFDLEEEIRLVENLLYDNSSLQLPEELNLEIIDTIIESSSPSPIPVADKLLNNDSLPLPKNESSILDHFNDPSPFCPPPEPLNVEISLIFEPDAPVINNFDELNEDECFDPRGGEINTSQNVEDDDSFTFIIQTFLPYFTYLADSLLLLSTE